MLTFSAAAVYMNQLRHDGELKNMIVPKIENLDNKLLQFCLVMLPKEKRIDATVSNAVISLNLRLIFIKVFFLNYNVRCAVLEFDDQLFSEASKSVLRFCKVSPELRCSAV